MILLVKDIPEKKLRNPAESVIVSYLDVFARRGADLPQPERQLNSVDEVAEAFLDFIPEHVKVVRDETVTTEYEGLPKLVFDFYQVNEPNIFKMMFLTVQEWYRGRKNKA